MKILIVLGCIALANGQLFGLGNPGKVLSQAKDFAKDTASKVTPSNTPLVRNEAFLEKLNDFGPALEGASSALNGYFDKSWGFFKDNLHKTYSSVAEETLRKDIFIKNINRVKEFTGKLPFGQKLNDFSDLLHDEFHSQFNGFNKAKKGDNVRPTEKPAAFKPPANEKIPESFDWREHGAVTPIKFQNSCAGCYAFSAAGALEGQFFRKSGSLKDLSVQNLIDCTKDYGNDGCQGGLMDPAFQYIKDNAGVNSEELYPFEAKNGNCRYKSDTSAGKSGGFVTIPEGDEAALKIAVATVGPVSAAIDASPESFQFYSDGVYHDPACKSDMGSMNHAVLIVGYGAEPDGKKYWLVKNSYGPNWGMEGYIKIARDAKNHCGIATIASYPIVE